MKLKNRVQRGFAALAMGLLLPATAVMADEPVTITVHADKPMQPVNQTLRGICIEDVNHEIYGGLYSQMIFGESFAEPALSAPVAGFRSYGGEWAVQDEAVAVDGNDGPKLVCDHPAFENGKIYVEMRFDNRDGDNAGLIVRVDKPGFGADAFTGYEISLSPSQQNLRLARHRNNYTLITDQHCDVQVAEWNALEVKLKGSSIDISVNGKVILQHDDGRESLAPGTVGLRAWHSKAAFRKLSIEPEGQESANVTFQQNKQNGAVSGMWRPIVTGSAGANFSLDEAHPFIGHQSQAVSFIGGEGEVGIENRGLNRWGMNFVSGKDYEGYVWLKANEATAVTAALESADGKMLAEQTLDVPAGDWQRFGLSLKPNAEDHAGRFAIKLKHPGTVTVGHAFLQPGEWGRYKGLPVRKDVAEGIVAMGVNVMRYGGSMVNSPNYHWKNMIGPRDRRPPYDGLWYHYSSNGWGAIDFLDLCEAMQITGIPDLNVNENPQDLADFVEYVNGPANSAWGKRRAEDGHPAPYKLRYLEVGNEEHVNKEYADKFVASADAIWKKDPDIILVVGDFAYNRKIVDPDHFTGADGQITNLDGQRQILRFAKEHNREVWFDVHIWSEALKPSSNLVATPTFMDQLEKIADGAKHRVLCFELNANSHGIQRALANAMTTNTLIRDNRMPIITSANGLQPDGQNDNGWDQGLLFLNPQQTWLQPPGYVMKMQAGISGHVLPCEVSAADGSHLDVTATLDENGKQLVLQIVNLGESQSAEIQLPGFVQSKMSAQVEELAGEIKADNTNGQPLAVKPIESSWDFEVKNGSLHREIPGHSFTVIRFR